MKTDVNYFLSWKITRLIDKLSLTHGQWFVSNCPNVPEPSWRSENERGKFRMSLTSSISPVYHCQRHQMSPDGALPDFCFSNFMLLLMQTFVFAPNSLCFLLQSRLCCISPEYSIPLNYHPGVQCCFSSSCKTMDDWSVVSFRRPSTGRLISLPFFCS